MQDSLPAGGLRLYREGVEPSGSLRKVSGYITILLSRTCPVARVVYAKRPFGGPDAVLAYLSRYTHRIAIANSRLVAFDGERETFTWKDYRAKGEARYKLMTLDADEFIRRFLIHVLPDGFHRIRHYGLLANANRAGNIALARRLLGAPDPPPSSGDSRKSSRRPRVERLPLLRRAYDHHRDLRTRLPAAAVAYPTDRARQFMTITPLSPSPITDSARRRHLTGTGHTSPTATVSAAFSRQNLEHRVPDPCADRIHGGQNQRSAGHSTVVMSGTDQSDQAAPANSP